MGNHPDVHRRVTDSSNPAMSTGTRNMCPNSINRYSSASQMKIILLLAVVPPHAVGIFLRSKLLVGVIVGLIYSSILLSTVFSIKWIAFANKVNVQGGYRQKITEMLSRSSESELRAESA